MDSSDSLKLDENLARFLAAYDQGIEGGDASAITVHVPRPSDPVPPVERSVTPIHPGSSNEGSLGEVMPDPERTARMRPPIMGSGAGSLPVGGPHRIGRFELRRQLGKGGCGIVFLAYDPKLQREVALKIPRPEMLLNVDAKRRLIREALAAAEFDHPNLVPVYETGEIGPVCYIATAFCPGQTLAEWLDRQAFPVPVRQAARLVATVADAVQHAHDRGVLHRDLKPNNVILQELKIEENDEPPPGSVMLRGHHLVPRLVDFGLAKLIERGGPSETATRQILGTPKYMSPEQAQARREDIGPPADVYALGVILYEMIAGRAPYDGASDVEVLRQAVEGKPVPPRELRPDAPRDLEAICLKAMARTTTARYRTAIDLADDLRRFLEGRPTIARPLAWSGRAVRWLRRNDQVVAIVVLTVSVLFVTALASWNSYLSQQLRKDHADVQTDLANRNRAEQEIAYSRHMQEAAAAWRSGNAPAAAASLEAAQRAAAALIESPDITHDYLARLVKTAPLTIVCPAGPVTALAVSPDGTRLASGHADGTLTVWDRATGSQLGTVKAHELDLTHLGFALGGTLLVSSGKVDGHSSMLGWSVAQDGSLAPATGNLRALGADISCFAIAPDGLTLFASGRGGLLMKRRFTEPAAVVGRAGAGAAAVTALAISRDGKRILLADASGGVLFWTADLKLESAWEHRFPTEVTALAANSDGLPIVGFANGNVWMSEPMKPPRTENAGGRVSWLAVGADGNFAAGGSPGRIHFGNGTDLATGDTGDVSAGVFAANGRTFFTGSRDGIIRAWDVTRDTRDRGATACDRIVAIGISPDGGRFVVADQRRVTRYEHLSAGRIVDGGPSPLVAVRFPDDTTTRGVALIGDSVVVSELSGSASTVRFRVSLPDGRTATAARLTPSAAYLAVGDDIGRVTVWAMDNQQVLGTIDTGLHRPVRAIAFSPDGHTLAAPVATGIGLWGIGTPEPIATLPTDDGAVFCFLPNGDRIATAGRDGAVRIWNTSGKEEATLHGHVGRVTALGVSPNGRTLVSGGAIGTVKFWDLRTGLELLSVRRHSTPVTVIEFASEGKLLVTGGDGQFAVWDGRPE